VVKVAIPQLEESVAPCFEAARRFIIGTVERGQVTSSRTVDCSEPEGHKRIRLLQIHGVKVLICNGIKSHFHDMLVASGITVIKDVSSSCEEALKKLVAGELAPSTPSRDDLPESSATPHWKLVEWARKLFEEGGYAVSPVSNQDYQLVDLVAEIKCPVCDRKVRVAICCGSHTYRPSQEIPEFHHATPTGFNARVYVCPTSSAVIECCQEYGIELLDPDVKRAGRGVRSRYKLPVLRGQVQNHEKASQTVKKT